MAETSESSAKETPTPVETEEKYSLKWNSYTKNLSESIESMRYYNELVDCTIYCEGYKKIVAHQLILSACSLYFRDILREIQAKHPVIVLKNIEYLDMVAIIRFMYQGEVQVKASQLQSFLDTAALLQVRGLVNDKNKSKVEATDKDSCASTSPRAETALDTKLDDKLMQPPAIPKIKRRKRKSSLKTSSKKRHYSDDGDDDYDNEDVKMEMKSDDDDMMEEEGGEMYKCSQCPKTFRHPMSLTLHRDMHSGKTACPVCHRSFSRAYDMRSHMMRVHSKECESKDWSFISVE